LGKAKDIIVRPIHSKHAVPFIKRHHYSGSVVSNSLLHFGVFIHNVLHGVMSYGPPMDKSKVISLVSNSKWHDMLELNRMAFDSFLPRNSESRAIGFSIRYIKKKYPNINWVLSFSDATRCGDGTIYRASGFKLTGIKPNKTIYLMPDGQHIADMTITADFQKKKMRDLCDSLKMPVKYRTMYEWKKLGAIPVPGFQLRYIKVLNPNCKLTVPEIPFSEIAKAGAKMYLGVNQAGTCSEGPAIPSQERRCKTDLPAPISPPNKDGANG